jgi:hypothetical protein
MTKDIMTDLLAKLSVPGLAINQKEAYEGQFEDISDFLIVPPSAFVAVKRLTNSSEALCLNLDYYAEIYLVTTHIHASGSSSMLDLIDAVVAALHFQAVNQGTYTGRIMFTDGDWLGIFPGFSAYKLNFTIRS